MNNLRPLLKNYVSDAIRFHDEYHAGSFEGCEETACRLALDIMHERVRPETYQAIIDGKESLSHDS